MNEKESKIPIYIIIIVVALIVAAVATAGYYTYGKPSQLQTKRITTSFISTEIPPPVPFPFDNNIVVSSLKLLSGYKFTLYGHSSLPENKCLQSQLYANDNQVSWWPKDQCTKIRNGTWQIIVMLNQSGAPKDLNQTVFYSIHIWQKDNLSNKIVFPFDVAGPPPISLFSWDQVPGNDSERLIEFLKQQFDIGWVETAKIEKIDNNRSIRVTAKKNYLSLELNNERTKVNLKIDDGRSFEFIAKSEDSKLNIYPAPMPSVVFVIDNMDTTNHIVNVQVFDSSNKLLLNETYYSEPSQNVYYPENGWKDAHEKDRLFPKGSYKFIITLDGNVTETYQDSMDTWSSVYVEIDNNGNMQIGKIMT